MKLIGELIEVISERAGLGKLREVGEFLKTGRRSGGDTPGASAGERVKDLLDVVGSDLLDVGQMVIAGMKSTTGKGAPDTGLLFGHGQSGFIQVGETLQSAVPNDSWNGSGSRAYADQDTRQQLRAETMADADRAVHTVLAREAFQINQRRGALDDQSNFLADTSYVTYPLQFIPRYGDAAKLVIEMAALQSALGVSAFELYNLHSDVSANAAELQQTIGRYSAVADTSELSGTGIDFGPQPQRGTIPIERADDTSAGVAAPSVAAVAGGAGAAPSVGAPAAAPETPVISPPTLPDVPTPSPPTAAAGQPPASGSAPAGGAGALGSLMGSLGGLLTGVALAAGQQAASADQSGRSDDENSGDKDAKDATERPEAGDEPKSTDNEDKAKAPAQDVPSAAPGDSETERAPVQVEGDFSPDRLQTPVPVILDPDTSPGPRAGMSPQDEM